MSQSISSHTSISLLYRLRQNDRDPEAWSEFVDRYGKRIYEWCLNRHLQTSDAEDVTQNVLVKLARSLGTFDYDERESFRGWLRRITENAVTDFFRELKSRKRLQELVVTLPKLETKDAWTELEQRLEAAFEIELLEAAKARVQARVERQRWLAWEWTAVDQRPGNEVAEALNMKLPTVYSSRYQIQKMIADEIRHLENSDSVAKE